MIPLIVFWAVMGWVVALIAHSKGYDAVTWFFYGLAIWPIALVHILVKPTDPRIARAAQSVGMKQCPDCAELVQPEAKRCRFCGYAF